MAAAAGSLGVLGRVKQLWRRRAASTSGGGD